MGDKIAQLNTLLNSGQLDGALKVALANPPYGLSESEKTKDLDAVIQILVTFKDAQIDKALPQLSVEELDVLTKYIFKGFENGNNSNSLFKWFEKTKNQAGGLGCIMRVLTDKNRL